MAVTDGAGHWFLVNASPDLPSQIETHPDLQPAGGSSRNSPIAGVLLTNADLDHALGLFSLREGSRIEIYAPRAVRETLITHLNLAAILESFCGISWHEPPKTGFAPLGPEGAPTTGLLYRAIELPGTPPPFAKAAPGAHSVAYQFTDSRTGGRLLVAPDVAGLNEPLLRALSNSDIILFDGTFWSGDELAGVKPQAPKATEMGHVTIKDCSLELLRNLTARQKILIHINNTNPVLAPESPERAVAEAAGITIGADGLDFEL